MPVFAIHVLSGTANLEWKAYIPLYKTDEITKWIHWKVRTMVYRMCGLAHRNTVVVSLLALVRFRCVICLLLSTWTNSRPTNCDIASKAYE